MKWCREWALIIHNRLNFQVCGFRRTRTRTGSGFSRALPESGKLFAMHTRLTMMLLAGGVLLSAQGKLPSDVDPKSYSRLPLLTRDKLDANGQRVYDFINSGQTIQRLGPAATVLYSPSLGEPFEALNTAERKSAAGPRYFEICALIASREFDQGYVWSAHEVAAQRAGIEQRVIDAIKFNRGVQGLPPKDAMLIRFGRALFKEHKVDSAMYAQVVELFGKQAMVDLTITMGDYAMTSTLLNAIDQQLPPDRKPLLPPK